MRIEVVRNELEVGGKEFGLSIRDNEPSILDNEVARNDFELSIINNEPSRKDNEAAGKEFEIARKEMRR